MRAECENQQKNSPLQNAMVSYSESLVYAFDYYHSTRMECLFLWLSGDISFFRITRDLVSLSCLHIYVLYNDTFIYYLLHLYLYICERLRQIHHHSINIYIYMFQPAKVEATLAWNTDVGNGTRAGRSTEPTMRSTWFDFAAQQEPECTTSASFGAMTARAPWHEI